MGEANRPHPLNVPGPFYVVDGCCTACHVPFQQAPELFQYDAHDHCFVKRQPATQAELGGMLRAAQAAELQCIRYRGQNRDVLRWFDECGESGLCDESASGNA